MRDVFLRTKQLAEQGDSSAQNDLGIMYFNGEDIEQSYEEAEYWFRVAALQGNLCSVGI